MSVRMRRAAAAVLTASALCLTAACGGGGDEDKKPAAAEKAGEKSSAPAEDKPASTEPLTAAQMKAATLELGDLPSGWKVSKVPAGEDAAPKADKPECQPLADMMGDKVEGAEKGGDVDYQGPGTEVELSQQVFTFPGTGAADYVKSFDTALNSCTTVPFDMEGEKIPVKIARIDAPKAAESSHAFTMAIEFAPGMEIKVNMLVAQQGTGATRVAYVNDGGAEAQKNFGDLVTKIGDKLAKGAQS